jgi:hypothetical protein
LLRTNNVISAIYFSANYRGWVEIFFKKSGPLYISGDEFSEE